MSKSINFLYHSDVEQRKHYVEFIFIQFYFEERQIKLKFILLANTLKYEFYGVSIHNEY